MNVSLTKHFDDFIEGMVESGRYDNRSEVIRAGLRLLEQQHRVDEAKIASLKAQIQEGLDQLDRGEGRPFDPERITSEGRSRLAKKK